jgi:hypothetical protein
VGGVNTSIDSANQISPFCLGAYCAMACPLLVLPMAPLSDSLGQYLMAKSLLFSTG